MEADQNLVEKVKVGDMSAFSELVTRHQKSLLRLAFRVVGDFEVAQDVVQESFLKAYQKISSFEGRSQFKSWVFQITLNTAKNKIRGKRREMVDIDNVHLMASDNTELELAQGDLRDFIRGAVDQLPPKQKTALTLRIFEDLSFAEIAEIMACPYDTAKANYRHALIKLRHSLADCHELEGWFPAELKKVAEIDA